MVRDSRFDFYKAILIIGVVWGHIINHMVIGETVSISIHTFFRTYDMPFFMAISGFFFRGSCEKYSFKVNFLNKLTMILIPSVLWSLLLSHFQSIDRYYFLTAVFFSSIIVGLIHTLIKIEKNQIVFIWLVSLLFYFIDLPLANMAYLYPFFAMGYTCPTIWDATKKTLIISGIIGTFVILLCFWKKDYNIWNSGSYILGGAKL